MRSQSIRVLGLAIVLIGTGSLAWAQRTTSTVTGTVADVSGGVLPGVDVELLNQDTGIADRQVTSAAGEFLFNFVPPGTYTLSVVLAGFRPAKETDLVLGAGQSIRRRFVLEVGEFEEAMTVTGASPMVNAVSPEQRIELQPLEVTNLPVPNRNLTGMLGIGTGLTKQSATEGSFGARLRMNGLGASSMSITANGTDASGNAGARMLSAYGGVSKIDLMSTEAIGEVQIVKGVFPAEYSHAMAGNLNVTTKAGTNSFHGSAFYRYGADELSARQPLLTTKPPSEWQQYGGSFGGPILRDRAFFFGAYEGYQQSTGAVSSASVPTQRMRDIMLSALPYVETELLLSFYPLPNQPTPEGALNGAWIGPAEQIADDNHFDARGDVRFWGGNLSAVFATGRPYYVSPRTMPTNPRVFESRSRRLSATYAKAVGRWSTETRFGYNYNWLSRTERFVNVVDPVTPATLPGMRGAPSISYPGISGVDSEAHIRGVVPSYSFEQQVVLVTDKHSIKFGGAYLRPSGGRTNLETPVVSYANLADLQANRPSQVRYGGGAAPNNWWTNNVGVFIQDDWRVTSRLVINAGLRYDWFGGFNVKATGELPAAWFNYDGLLDQNFTFGPLRDASKPIEPDAGANLGPRLGFAYSVDDMAKTVVRGGWGMMFQPPDLQIFETAISRSERVPRRRVFSAAEAARYGLQWPIYNEELIALLETFTGPPEVAAQADPNIQAPYAHVFTIGLQRALTDAIVLESTYVMTLGRKFVMSRTYNQVDRATGLRPNPNLQQDFYFDNEQETTYHSWQTSLRQRMTRNAQFSAYYTLSRNRANFGGDMAGSYIGDTYDAVQDFWNPDAEWGPAVGDVTHSFSGTLIYEVPSEWFSSRVLRHLVGGWQVAGIVRVDSGIPFTVTQTSTTVGARPDLVDPGNAINPNFGANDLQYLNKAAFATVPLNPVSRATVRPGTYPNNGLRLPATKKADLSFAKFVDVGAGRRVELRLDLLNAFNWVTYTAIQRSINASNFGRVTGTGTAREVQLQIRFSF